MTRCKICKTNIPDGTEYCADCQDQKNINANESYLDNLLSSVKNTAPTAESIYKKKNFSNKNSIVNSNKSNSDNLDREDVNHNLNFEHTDVTEDIDWNEIASYEVDPNDIHDFEQFNMEEDLTDLPDDFVISDAELFGQNLSDILADENNSMQLQQTIQPDIKSEDTINANTIIEDTIIEDNIIEDINKESLNDDDLQVDDSEQNEDLLQMMESDLEDIYSEREALEEELQEKIIPGDEVTEDTYTLDVNQSGNIEDEELLSEENDSYYTPEEIPELEDEDFDPDLNELLNSLNTIPEGYSEEEQNREDAQVQDKNTIQNQEETSNLHDIEQEEDDDDFLSLLNQISSDDPVSEDVKAINDLLQGKPVEETKSDGMPSDVGEVFSDALKGISSLSDEDLNENDLLNKVPEGAGKKGKTKKKKKVAKNTKAEKSEKGFFQTLFGNVKDEKTQKKATSTENANSEESLSLKETQGKETPQKETGKKGKGKKSKKGAPEKSEEEESSEDGKGKEKVSKKDKKEKKEKQKKTKEIIQVIDEIEEDEGRINRLGASIVFILFGLLAVLIIVGTNTVSYTISIENATKYFENRKYTEAYSEVYGIEFKDKDIEIYDKIKTVMFVNKQLNSYNNYYSIGEYPEALDSLLKGLQRYDKYIELATMLGIDSDLNYVRSQILAELDNEFKLSEKDALKIISYNNQKKYSLAVYDVVLDNSNN